MPERVMRVGLPERVHSLDRGGAIAGPAVERQAGVEALDVVRLLFDSIAAHGLQKEAAYYLRVEDSYLSKIKGGKKTLPLHRLSCLPAPVLETFFKLGAKALGGASSQRLRAKVSVLAKTAVDVLEDIDALGERRRRARVGTRR